LPWRPAGGLEAFGGFEAGQTAVLNPRWQGHVVAVRVVALEACGRVGSVWGRVPLLATREPSSTPPVFPGAAPALAKAGVGGYYNLYYIRYTVVLQNYTILYNHVYFINYITIE